jgi:hypothetical protein
MLVVLDKPVSVCVIDPRACVCLRARAVGE